MGQKSMYDILHKIVTFLFVWFSGWMQAFDLLFLVLFQNPTEMLSYRGVLI